MLDKRFISAVGILIAGVFSFAGCITEPDLGNYPAVSFQNEVQPIIAANCSQSGCHGAVAPEEFTLQTYEEVMLHVKAGDGRKSALYEVITDRGEEFMPPSPSAPLTDDQIRTIFVWIEQGAPNN
jgi:hypothetical protein